MAKYSDEFILNEIKRVARELDQSSVKARQFRGRSCISFGTVVNRFGSWNSAVEAAGLDPIDRVQVALEANERARISDEELLRDLLRLAKDGSCPTIARISSEGKYSPSVYRRRFGSHTNAYDEACKRFPEGAGGTGPKNVSERTPRAFFSNRISLPLGDSLPQTVYGERIDFRGLTFAPVNEAGVVFLFGMVARELGFCIESVRAEFPDCEGKMCISKDGSKWAHVRIEFEYCSSNFREHGHDPNGCDLVICWVNDWSDCPKEVLELKSAISSLASNT